MRIAILLTALLTIVSVGLAADENKAMARGKELTKLFQAGKSDALWTQMSPGMQKFMRGQAAFDKFCKQSHTEIGQEIEVLSEKVRSDDGFMVYTRTSRWSKHPGRVEIEWAIDGDDHVVGFGVKPEEPADGAQTGQNAEYQTQSNLRLPFDGDWHVFWGGRNADQNIHVPNRAQRYAYDLVIYRAGKSHAGQGKRLEDYYCWNAPILAPADASVVAVVDGRADQVPGTMDKELLPGNHVILDLGNGEYAVLAHLKMGSILVKSGDRVQAGREIGRCGNSGNTSEPHLHFHLQNSARLGEGDGLPAPFTSYFADGKLVERGEPVRGQTIRAR